MKATRIVVHNSEQKVTLAAEIDENSRVYTTYAICAPQDTFTRKRGFHIVNRRLDLRGKRKSVPVFEGDTLLEGEGPKEIRQYLRRAADSLCLTPCWILSLSNKKSRIFSQLSALDRLRRVESAVRQVATGRDRLQKVLTT